VRTIVDQISGQRDRQIVPEGLQGAGNLPLFDNEGEAGDPPAALKLFEGSRVLEIDPVKQQIVWEYNGGDWDRPQWTFRATGRTSVQFDFCQCTGSQICLFAVY
jgi:hypothetical protein